MQAGSWQDILFRTRYFYDDLLDPKKIKIPRLLGVFLYEERGLPHISEVRMCDEYYEA